MTQVAGRAGRADVPGEVVVQSTVPDTPALKFAMRHDYEGFAACELNMRRAIEFPPFSRLTRIVVADDRENTAQGQAQSLADRLSNTIASLGLDNADVLGPSPCALARIRGRYRYDLLLRARTAAEMQRLLTEANAQDALRVKAKSVVIDVDPVSLS